MKLVVELPRTKIRFELDDANWNKIEQLRADFAEMAGDLIVPEAPKAKKAKKETCPVCGKRFLRVAQHKSRMHKNAPAFTQRKMHEPREGGVAREVSDQGEVRDLHEHDVPAPGRVAGGGEDAPRFSLTDRS